MSYINKIKTKEGFKQFVKNCQSSNKKVVQCHGCFDIIHPGHIRYLEQAKSLGDILVVSLTADKFILVTEYMENGSLFDQLHKKKKKFTDN